MHKVRVFYQDFAHNAMVLAMVLGKENLVVFPIRATLIAELNSDDMKERWDFPDNSGYEDFADKIWELMNLHPHETVGDKNIHKFAEVGHTSMSVGDYIEWMDGTLWIAAPCGWEITTRCKVCNANERCVREFQDCEFCLANVVGKK